eukprot:4182891-Alexandrium_andersonii.AAC.1
MCIRDSNTKPPWALALGRLGLSSSTSRQHPRSRPLELATRHRVGTSTQPPPWGPPRGPRLQEDWMS